MDCFQSIVRYFVMVVSMNPRIDRWSPRHCVVAVGATGAWLAGASLAGDFGAILLVVPLVVAGWVALATRLDVGVETVLLVGGLGLLLAMELVYAQVYPSREPRWNTTLEVAIQAWVLCGLAAGPIAAGPLVEARLPVRIAEARKRHTLARFDAPDLRAALATVGVSAAVVVLIAGVIAGASVFGALVVHQQVAEPVTHRGTEHASFDGLQAHRWGNSEEVEAVEWLDAEAGREQSALWMERRTGQPVVVEAPGDVSYSERNFAATLTGLPTVAGWPHQVGYRGEAAYEARVVAVNRMLTDETAFRELVDAYDVAYVYIGPTERYGDELIDVGAQPGVERVFENDEVRIYAVENGANER